MNLLAFNDILSQQISLANYVRVLNQKLYNKKNNQLIIDDIGVNAGLEIKDPEKLVPK